MAKGNFKKLAVGTLVAAAAGYVAGVLTAPKSGRETREDLKETAQKGMSQAERQLKSLHSELSRLIDEGKEKAQDLSGRTRNELSALLDKGNDARGKAREVLSALHEGTADDKELKKALADANKAIEHLKAYLKK